MKKRNPVIRLLGAFVLGYSVASLIANYKHQDEYAKMQKIQQEMVEALKLCTK